MLSFTNPGEIDIRLASVFGVNVKATTNPIGHFGTGLKYAIAITLRLGGEITIYSGLQQYIFSTESTSIREKDFDLVMMEHAGSKVQMPFTLELGKEWQPWMAYRELWSNAKDEQGTVQTGFVPPAVGRTVIVVDCNELDRAHSCAHEFMLPSKPIAVLNGLEVHKTPGKAIFYHGIKVGEFDKPGAFTYNLTYATDLTEDRTVKNMWIVKRGIAAKLMDADLSILEPILTNDKNWEWHEDWSQVNWNGFPEEFVAKVRKLNKVQRMKMPNSVVAAIKVDEMPTAMALTAVEKKMIAKALKFLEKIHQPVGDNIIAVESLGDGILGTVFKDNILISRECLMKGTKIVAGTILEEHLHIHKGLTDYSVRMQNYLLDLVMGLGEELTGEPL